MRLEKGLVTLILTSYLFPCSVQLIAGGKRLFTVHKKSTPVFVFQYIVILYVFVQRTVFYSSALIKKLLTVAVFYLNILQCVEFICQH